MLNNYNLFNFTWLNVFLKMIIFTYVLIINGFSIETSLVFAIGISLVIDYLFKKKEAFENEKPTNYLDTVYNTIQNQIVNIIGCTPNDPPQTLNMDGLNSTKATFNITTATLLNDNTCKKVDDPRIFNLSQSNYIERSLSTDTNNAFIDSNLLLLNSHEPNQSFKINLIVKAGYKVTCTNKEDSFIFASTPTDNGVFTDSVKIIEVLKDIQSISVSPL